MKNLVIIACLCLLACNKSIDVPQQPQKASKDPQKDPVSCDFGITVFNTIKRPTVADEFNARRSNPITTTTPPVTTPGAVIFLDFDGHLVSGTYWNYDSDINCAPANLTTAQVDEIVNRVSNDYSPFNVTVTTNQAVYDAANPGKRTRVVVTETYEWYGKVGGVSYVGSFTWGDNTPCFVFSLLLNYDTKKITEAISHEAGHTLGLLHQAKYDANCVMTSQYNSGQGSGEMGWAPIMGIGYYQNQTLWHNGATNYGCSSLQNDVAIISTAVGGTKTDDYSNTTTNAKQLTSSFDGLINTQGDVDFFYVNNTTSKTISVTPYSVGANNSGANVDLLLKVYNSSGTLISTVDNTSSLGASTTVSSGKYYLAVTTIADQYASTYGMLGKYNIKMQ